jgi:tRNA(Ile)-lysidine synthase
MSVFDPERLIRALAPFPEAGRVWVAYSGGLDSTVLLRAAAAVRERLPGALWAVHVDHGLNPDSARWAEHCQATCAGLAIPCEVRRLELSPAPGESLEAVAREARYGALATLLAPGDLLLTAHTQDDQAETLLLALIRGSGVHGLAAMPTVADLGLGRLVRPLLDARRPTLERYARALDLAWVEDPSNASLSIDRNYLRNLVMPLIKERWPAAPVTLSRAACHCAEAAAVVDQTAGESLCRLAGERPGTLSIPGLLGLAAPRRKAVLRLWLRRRGFGPPDTAHLERILSEVLRARPDADPLVAWPGCEIRRYRRDLYSMHPLPPQPRGLEIHWEGPTLDLPHGLGTLERVPEGPGAQLTGTQLRALRVCFGVTELTCRPLGIPHGRSLKNLYQEAGIPAWLRPYVPLLFDGNDLVAAVGVCRCEPANGPPQSDGEPDDRPPGPPAPPVPAVRWSGHPWEWLGYFA